MALLDTRTGEVTSVDRVERFAFSSDSAWLAYLQSAAPAEKSDSQKPPEAGSEAKKEPRGTPLKLRQLESGAETATPDVVAFAFDNAAKYLAFTVAADGGTGNGVFVKDLSVGGTPAITVNQTAQARYDHLTWLTMRARWPS